MNHGIPSTEDWQPAGAAFDGAFSWERGMIKVLVAFALTLFGVSFGSVAAAEHMASPVTGGSCANLRIASVNTAVGANTTISRAVERDLDGARYCVVEGVIAPVIRFEARLPVEGWSGRYLQTGCGGLCGTLSILVEHADSCVPVRAHGVVLASTDMGHEGMGGAWAARNPATRADFGHRGVHLTALAVKALIREYYGRPVQYSYISGCSDGGREALIEAQRYPKNSTASPPAHRR